jgi:2-(1,2-epoxy-1,2-dihydrophenyl)acetyl-CoA isomerase
MSPDPSAVPGIPDPDVPEAVGAEAVGVEAVGADPTAPEPVGYQVDGAVATVRLQRPEALNALNRAAKVGLLAALRRAADDTAVRVVVLTGSGRGPGAAFCAGQDLREHLADLGTPPAAPVSWPADAGRSATAGAPGGTEVPDTVREHYNPIATLLATMPKPVIAALNGTAAGAGAAFALACDFRILAAGGSFVFAFASAGLSCDSGTSWWLPRVVGAARAKELLMRPRKIPAGEALALGLVTQVVPEEGFEAAVAALAAELAEGPTLALASIRRAVAFAGSHDLADSLQNEATLMELTFASEDHRAATEAFVARRPTTFIGR